MCCARRLVCLSCASILWKRKRGESLNCLNPKPYERLFRVLKVKEWNFFLFVCWSGMMCVRYGAIIIVLRGREERCG